MKDSTLKAFTSPPITTEVWEAIKQAFPIQPVKDDDSLIAIGREAGRQDVVNYLHRYIKDSDILGEFPVKTEKKSWYQLLIPKI